MNLKYDMMKQEDIKDCAILFMECFKQEPWNENWSYEQSFDRLKEIMSSPFSFGYIVSDENKQVGMLCGRIMTYTNYKELWVDDFCVSLQYQGKGLGRLFLNSVKENLKGKGISRITLNTTRGYLSDIFYKKSGFQESEEIVNMYCEL